MFHCRGTKVIFYMETLNHIKKLQKKLQGLIYINYFFYMSILVILHRTKLLIYPTETFIITNIYLLHTPSCKGVYLYFNIDRGI